MTETRSETIPRQIDGLHYSCQWDPRWSDAPYSVTGATEQTLGNSGCVPTLQTVVLNNTAGVIADPPMLAGWNIDNGFRTADNGTKRASWNLLVDQAGLKQENVDADFDSVAAALQVGGFVITSLKAPDRLGLGTPSGHVVGIHAITNNEQLRVIDVNSPEKSQLDWPQELVLPFINSRLRHIFAAPNRIARVSTLKQAPHWRRLMAELTQRG